MIEASVPSAPVAPALRITRATRLAEIDSAAWDGLVPRDIPHLRTGFMRALEESRFPCHPHYLCVWRDDRLVGVTAAYGLEVDLLTLALPTYQRAAAAIRRRWPRFLFLTAVMCGPFLSGCSPGFCLASDLSPEEAQETLGALIGGLEAIPEGSAVAVIECAPDVAALYRPQMAAHGFLEAPSLLNSRLDVHWRTFEAYVASMRKAFRRSVVKDRRAAAGIDFRVVDDFSEIAEEAWALYKNVLDRADTVFHTMTPELFQALGRYEQARLVTARDRQTGRLIGIELLLCGDTLVQDLYTGLDYGYNDEQRLYFNLIYPVIAFAGEGGYRSLYLGQTSYTFKARLGAKAVPTFIFAKHRNRFIHRILQVFRSQLFPREEATAYNVFRSPGEESASAIDA